jgi:predicted DNA-binding transcriptional regulator AlpA
MITAQTAVNLFGNSWSRPVSNPPTAPKTGHTCGNTPHLPTPTYHRDPSCSCRPSPNDSDGKPNTPPLNSRPPAHHPTQTVRQLSIKQLEEGDRSMSQTTRVVPLWTVQDVADYLQVPVQTLYSWRMQGRGPRARKIGKYLRYRPEDVITWLDQLDDGAA